MNSPAARSLCAHLARGGARRSVAYETLNIDQPRTLVHLEIIDFCDRRVDRQPGHGMQSLTHATGRARRFGALLFAILFVYYGGLYWLWLAGAGFYDRWMKFIGVTAWKFPFLDIIAVLSWGDCHHAGFDVLYSNPCDPLNRPFAYSPILLDLPIHWLGVRHATAVGLVLDGAFLIMVPFLLRPDSRRALLIAILAGLSPAVVFLLERANLDIFVFTLVGAAALWATRGPAQRYLSYIVYFAAGLMKYYPLILLGLIVRERPRIALAIGAAAGAILIAFATYYWSIMRQELMPETRYFGNMIGGALLPFGVAIYFGLSHRAGEIMFVALLIVMVLVAVRLAGRLKTELSAADWNRPNFLLLVVGAALTVGCFVAGPSVGYRAAVLLFVIPGLLELQARARDRGLRLVAWGALAAALLCLWRQFIETRLIDAGLLRIDSIGGLEFLLVREALWWGLVSVLTAFIVVYVLHSPMWRAAMTGYAHLTAR